MFRIDFACSFARSWLTTSVVQVQCQILTFYVGSAPVHVGYLICLGYLIINFVIGLWTLSTTRPSGSSSTPSAAGVAAGAGTLGRQSWKRWRRTSVSVVAPARGGPFRGRPLSGTVRHLVLHLWRAALPCLRRGLPNRPPRPW
jgi:hypothetical protein